MLQDKFAHLIDGVNAVEIAVALRHSPSEQAVATENKAFCFRTFSYGLLNQERQFKARALPGNPHDVATEFSIKLSQLPVAIGTCRQGDGPVGMKMIDVQEGKEGM